MNVRSVAITLAVTACISLSSIAPIASAADPYDIYAILPLTGSNSFNGREEREALGVLQASVNRGGGIKGRAINFVVLDSQTSPQVAVELTNQVIAKHVPLLVGDTSTGTCAAMAPLLTNGPVQFCLSPGFTPTPGGYSYALAPTPEAVAIAVMHYFVQRKWNRVALLLGTDATGQLIAKTYAQVAALPENHAIQIVAEERFNPTDISVAAQLARIKAAQAQVLVPYVTGTPFTMVLRSLRDTGISLPVATSPGNLNYAALASAGDAIPQTLIFCNGPIPAAGEPLPNSPHKAAQLAYLAAFQAEGIKPEYGDAVVWDTGTVIVAALRTLGLSATADQIRTYVNGMHGYPGVEGMFDFRDGKMRGLSELGFMQWDRARSTWDILTNTPTR